MRLVLLITMGLERPGGVRYFNLARELVRAGHQVRVLALHPDFADCTNRRFVRDGVEVWYVGQMHARKHATVPARFRSPDLLRVLVRSTLGMIWGIICSPADAYHLGKPQPINGVAALLGVRLLRRQRFYVDWDDDEVKGNRLTSRWQRAVFAFWQWLLIRLAAGVTVNTHFLEQRLPYRHAHTSAYVPNGVDLQQFQPLAPPMRAGLRAALGLNQYKIVAYAGTLAFHNHPVDLLIRAFAKVASADPDVHLLMIGGGEDLPTVRALVASLGLQKQVHFTGWIPHEQVRAYLALADVSVDPVRSDDVARSRSPLKLVESMAVAVPVITGDVGDRKSVLAGGAGWLAAPDDVDALTRILERVLADPAALRKASLAALKQAQQFSWQHLSARWIAVYNTAPIPVSRSKCFGKSSGS